MPAASSCSLRVAGSISPLLILLEAVGAKWACSGDSEAGSTEESKRRAAENFPLEQALGKAKRPWAAAAQGGSVPLGTSVGAAEDSPGYSRTQPPLFVEPLRWDGERPPGGWCGQQGGKQRSEALGKPPWHCPRFPAGSEVSGSDQSAERSWQLLLSCLCFGSAGSSGCFPAPGAGSSCLLWWLPGSGNPGAGAKE